MYFQTYFNLGLQHIADFRAYDHMLFLAVLVIPFLLQDWKKILGLITAFTLGHTLSLALAVYDVIALDATLIEKLIPCTIIATAINVLLNPKATVGVWNYIITVFFGLIHGLGFSNYLKVLLQSGESKGKALFAFNCGLEIGQILIVIAFLMLSTLFRKWITPRQWSVTIASIAICCSIYLLFS